MLATPEFVSGENFSYLGRNYRLKIVRVMQKSLWRFDGTILLAGRKRRMGRGREPLIRLLGISAPDAAGLGERAAGLEAPKN